MVFEKISKGKILVSAILFALFWAVIITTQATYFESLPSTIQFILVTLVSYAIPSIIFGIAHESQEKRQALGFFFFITAVDLLAPPLGIGIDGVISTQAMFSGAAIDSVLGQFFSQYVSGLMLFIVVYPAMFLVLISISLYLLNKQNLLKLAKTW